MQRDEQVLVARVRGATVSTALRTFANVNQQDAGLSYLLLEAAKSIEQLLAVVSTTGDEPFNPSDRARAVFAKLMDRIRVSAIDEFFALWEAENDPRKAGSMVAHGYSRNAARAAVFGSICAKHKPQLSLWLACCEADFHAAMEDVTKAFEEVDEQKPATPKVLHVDGGNVYVEEAEAKSDHR